jgi:chemotaxis protein histidine kinase CheA
LRRAAHTLQGLAATIGAQPLHHLALALERSAAGTDAAAAGRLLERADAALATLLGEIRSALAHAAASEPPLGAGPGNLAELRQLLSQSDSRALDWWQAHGPHAALDDATRRRLQQALAALDFDAALLALKGTT